MLNHGTKLENNKETPSWKLSTQEGLALVAALSQQDETKTNTQTGLLATYSSPISSSNTFLVEFCLFCGILFSRTEGG